MMHLKVLLNIIKIELVDDIEDRIEEICHNLNKLFNITSNQTILRLLVQIYTIFETKYTDNEFLLKNFFSVAFNDVMNVFSTKFLYCDDKLFFACVDFLRATCFTYVQNLKEVQLVINYVVIPNLSLSDQDLENFKSEQDYFIKMDIDGASYVSKRSAVLDLFTNIRRLCDAREIPMYHEYNSSKIDELYGMYCQNNNVKHFDTMISLFFAHTIQGELNREGVISLAKKTSKENVTEFCKNVILNRIAMGYNTDPVVLCLCLKFVTRFRSILLFEERLI